MSRDCSKSLTRVYTAEVSVEAASIAVSVVYVPARAISHQTAAVSIAVVSGRLRLSSRQVSTKDVGSLATAMMAWKGRSLKGLVVHACACRAEEFAAAV